MDILHYFVHHDCFDRDMVRNTVELADFLREDVFGCAYCIFLICLAFRASDDDHGSSDRRMSIAVDEGLIELILTLEHRVNDPTKDNLKSIVELLERGATRGSKLCLSMARVDVEELIRLPDANTDAPLLRRIEQLVGSARGLCTRTCTCCAVSLSVGRIFRCDNCGTVYCSRNCQVCVARCVWSTSSRVLSCRL